MLISFSEIHLTAAAHTKLGWTRQVFFSSFSSQAKVVVTLITGRSKFLFQQDRVSEDNESLVAGFVASESMVHVHTY